MLAHGTHIEFVIAVHRGHAAAAAARAAAGGATGGVGGGRGGAGTLDPLGSFTHIS